MGGGGGRRLLMALGLDVSLYCSPSKPQIIEAVFFFVVFLFLLLFLFFFSFFFNIKI